MVLPGKLLSAGVLSEKAIAWASDFGPAFPPLPRGAEVAHFWGGPHPIELRVTIRQDGSVTLDVVEGFDRRTEFAQIDSSEAIAILDQLESLEPELSEIRALGHEPSDDLEELHLSLDGLPVTFPVWDDKLKVKVPRRDGESSSVASPALEALFRRCDELIRRLFGQNVKYPLLPRVPPGPEFGCRTTVQEDPIHGRVLHVVLARNQTVDSWKHVRETLQDAVDRARPQRLLIDLRDLASLYGAPLIGVLAVGAAAMRKLGTDRRTRIVAHGRIADSLGSTIRIAKIDMLFGGRIHPDTDSALRDQGEIPDKPTV
jgi:hypothetical protein